MARIRTVKPEFFRHEGLYLSEMETGLPLRLAFEGLWTVADREGRFRWRPRVLKLDCLPHDEVDFSKILDALAERGYVEKYEAGGEFYGWIPTFLKHQVINNRERASELPDPLDPTISTRHPRVSDTRLTPLSSAQAEVEYGNGNGNGKEMEVETERTPKPPKGARRCEFGICGLPDPAKCLEAFDQFWINYPRHEPGRRKTRTAWCKAQRDGGLPQMADLLAWLDQAKVSDQWQITDKVPHATTWLNQRRWEGDPPPRTIGGKPNGPDTGHSQRRERNPHSGPRYDPEKLFQD